EQCRDGQHVADDLVHRHVVAEPGADPALELRGDELQQAVAAARLRDPQLAQGRGEVVQVAGPGEQLVDLLVALVGVLALDEGAGFGRGRDAADEVERQPAEVLRVVGPRGGGDLVCVPECVEVPIDLADDRIDESIGRYVAGRRGPFAGGDREDDPESQCNEGEEAEGGHVVLTRLSWRSTRKTPAGGRYFGAGDEVVTDVPAEFNVFPSCSNPSRRIRRNVRLIRGPTGFRVFGTPCRQWCWLVPPMTSKLPCGKLNSSVSPDAGCLR